MLHIALIFGLAALLLFWLAYRQRKSTGLPGGAIIYTDTRLWNKLAEPLYNSELGVTGKPDYLIETGQWVIPVEVKSTRVSEGPYDSHIYQLAVYCLLVEKTFQKRPPYGILHYPNQDYRVDFTPELEAHTLALLNEMRLNDRRRSLERSHNEPARCRRCGYRSNCEQRLN